MADRKNIGKPVSPEKLKKVVKQAGSNVKDVEAYLEKKPDSEK